MNILELILIISLRSGVGWKFFEQENGQNTCCNWENFICRDAKWTINIVLFW